MTQPIPQLPAHCFVAGSPPHRRFWRMFFRFLNVVEPGPEIVLSPTRVGMWIVVFVIPYMAIFMPGNIVTLLAAATPLVLNYMHQRYSDAHTGANPNAVDTSDTQVLS